MTDFGNITTKASLDSIVQQYRTSLKKPMTSLEDRRTKAKARLNVLAEMKIKLTTLSKTVKKIFETGDSLKLLEFTATSSSQSVVTATAKSSAIAGTHSIQVSQIAKADTLISSTLLAGETSIVDSEGVGSKTFSISINGNLTNINVDIAEGDTNKSILAKIANAVNNSSAKVKASVISTTSTESRLVFTSRETGSSNAINLSNSEGTLLNRIGLSEQILQSRTANTHTAGGYLHSSVSQLNAGFSFNGLNIIREKNTVDDILDGVTFDLKSTQNSGDQPVIIEILLDKEKIKTNLSRFVDDYNAVLKFINSKTSVDSSSGVRQILAGDTAFMNLKIKLRSILGAKINNVVPGNPELLSQIGFEVNPDGTLFLKDVAVLEDALSQDSNSLNFLFTSGEGIAHQIKMLLESFVSTGGILDKANDGANLQSKSITERIKQTEAKIERKVDRFRDEMVRLQSAMALVTNQQKMIQGMYNNLFY